MTLHLNALSVSLATITAVIALGACGAGDGTPTVDTSAAAQRQSARAQAQAKPQVVALPTGTVTSIVPIMRSEPVTGTGAVVGGVLGAVIGNQVGGGDGKKVATAVGAVGGAVIGNKVEKQRSSTVIGYRVDVRMEDGTVRTFEPSTIAGMSVGTRVRVESGTIRPA